MFKLLSIIFLTIFVNPIYGQTEVLTPAKDTSDIYIIVDKEPEIISGYKSLKKELRQKTPYKVDEKCTGKDKLIYSIIIDKEGKMESMEIIYNNLDSTYQITDLLINQLKWQPAIKDDKIVKSKYTMELCLLPH